MDLATSWLFRVFIRGGSGLTTATLEDLTAEWTITRIRLDMRAAVSDVPQSAFMGAALKAKANCPIARLLNTNINMTVTLNS